MNILFVHNAFPGQYVHLAPALAAAGHRVVALTLHAGVALPGVTVVRYALQRTSTPGVHPLAAEFESKMLRGEAAAAAAVEMKRQGFSPDVICAHPGWGEALFLKDVWPQARLLCYFEFFYQATGADMNFDSEFPLPPLESALRIRAKNAGNLLALEAADHGISPTWWQRGQFPEWARDRISVIHDGIDTDALQPDSSASIFDEVAGRELRAGDEIVTFVNRNLEPHRGFHIFMRALPALLRRRPDAQILIIGGDGISYGSAPGDGRTWKEKMLAEVGHELDLRRVRFLGQVPYRAYVRILQIAAVHVYLTYPFILSWSFLEAMSAGCLVVASRTPPVEEVIRAGENGMLVDFFDHQALAATVANALERRTAHAGMRNAARASILSGYDLRSICLPQQMALIERLR